MFIVTADNGVPFAGAQATMFDAAIDEPLAIQFPAWARGGRGVGDFAPNLLAAAGAPVPVDMVGRAAAGRECRSHTRLG